MLKQQHSVQLKRGNPDQITERRERMKTSVRAVRSVSLVISIHIFSIIRDNGLRLRQQVESHHSLKHICCMKQLRKNEESSHTRDGDQFVSFKHYSSLSRSLSYSIGIVNKH